MDGQYSNVISIRDALASARAPSSDYDLNPDLRPGGNRKLRPASVLVPLVERASGLNMILTRRAHRLAHHPGQISFPGGKQDPEDSSALVAALREAREEIGLREAQVSVLGEFDPHETVTSFCVTPFVGVVDEDFVPEPDRSEVDEVFEVPFGFVIDPASLQIHKRRWHGQWRSYYAIPYGPHYIWGATARMIKSLSERMHNL